MSDSAQDSPAASGQPQPRQGILAQATDSAIQTNLTLSQQIASQVMGWAREEKALRHMVSFYVLDEAVEIGLQGKTERAELTPEDVARVQQAVRTWSTPHIRDGVSLDGMDAVIAQAAERYTPADLVAARPKGPATMEVPAQQRPGAER